MNKNSIMSIHFLQFSFKSNINFLEVAVQIPPVGRTYCRKSGYEGQVSEQFPMKRKK